MDKLENGRNYAVLIPGAEGRYPEDEIASLVETLTLSGAKVIPHFIPGLTQVQVIDVSAHPAGWHRTPADISEGLRNSILGGYREAMPHEDGSVSFSPDSARTVLSTGPDGTVWTG